MIRSTAKPSAIGKSFDARIKYYRTTSSQLVCWKGRVTLSMRLYTHYGDWGGFGCNRPFFPSSSKWKTRGSFFKVMKIVTTFLNLTFARKLARARYFISGLMKAERSLRIPSLPSLFLGEGVASHFVILEGGIWESTQSWDTKIYQLPGTCECPLFFALAPPKQGLFQSKQGSSKGSRYILFPNSKTCL